MTQSDLAVALDLGKTAVSGLVNRAIRAGWIEQRADPVDRRSRSLYLTATARHGFAAMRRNVDAMHDRVFATISQAEGERVTAALQTLKNEWVKLAGGTSNTERD